MTTYTIHTKDGKTPYHVLAWAIKECFIETIFIIACFFGGIKDFLISFKVRLTIFFAFMFLVTSYGFAWVLIYALGIA